MFSKKSRALGLMFVASVMMSPVPTIASYKESDFYPQTYRASDETSTEEDRNNESGSTNGKKRARPERRLTSDFVRAPTGKINNSHRVTNDSVHHLNKRRRGGG